jgi:hypothetical protein
MIMLIPNFIKILAQLINKPWLLAIACPWNLATSLQTCYDSIVYEVWTKLSYQGGSAPSIGNPLWVMTQLWMNYNWVTKVEVIHPLETCYELWLNCGWTTTELPKFHLPPW